MKYVKENIIYDDVSMANKNVTQIKIYCYFNFLE